jgi:hypothetical protein
MIDQKSISIFLFLSQKNKKLKIYKSTFKSTFKKGGAKIIDIIKQYKYKYKLTNI